MQFFFLQTKFHFGHKQVLAIFGIPERRHNSRENVCLCDVFITYNSYNNKNETDI